MLGGAANTEKRGSQLLAVLGFDFPRVLVNQLLRKVHMPQL
jgi:hypothetical protein